MAKKVIDDPKQEALLVTLREGLLIWVALQDLWPDAFESTGEECSKIQERIEQLFKKAKPKLDFMSQVKAVADHLSVECKSPASDPTRVAWASVGKKRGKANG